MNSKTMTTILILAENTDYKQRIERMLLSKEHAQYIVLHQNIDIPERSYFTTHQVEVVLLEFLTKEFVLHSVAQLKAQMPEIPIILICTSCLEHIALEALHSGAASYLFIETLHQQELTRTIRCVTERHQIQQELANSYHIIQKNQEHFAAISEQIMDGLIIVNEYGKVLFVNPSTAKLLCSTKEELLHQHFGFPLVDGETTEIDIICHRSLEDSGLVRKSRPTMKTAEMRVSNIEWEGEKAFIATLHDITQRKKTEEALLQSEQRYKNMLVSLTDYLYTVDIVDGRPIKTTHSPNCVAVTGYTAEEYEHDQFLWYTMVYEEDRTLVTEYASRVISGKHVPPLEHRIIHKNGSIRWVKNTYVPRHNEHGKVIAYDGLVSDITERRLAEGEVRKLNANLEQRVRERTAQLEETNEELACEIQERKRAEEELRKLSRAVDQSPATIVITNPKGIIEYVNPRFCQVTGYSFEEAIGKNPRILKSNKFTSEDYKQMWDTITAGNEWRGEFLNRKKNGELYWEFASISPIVNDNGETTHYLAIKEDITERKQTEEALQQAHQQAEAATQAKSEFLANMSHEIRTPLNAIVGMSTLLTDTELTDQQQDFVATIRICCDSLLNIINDILDFSKIEAGRIELDYKPFMLADTIEDSIELVSTRTAEKDIELVSLIDKQIPPIIMGDFLRLRQILVNLLSNAVKFTDKGEVVVIVEQSDQTYAMPDHDGQLAEIDCSIPAPPSIGIHFSIRDTGIGIAPEQQDKLFRSFSQIDTSKSHRQEGTGLGLVISKRLAELMGGTMWAESQFGVGSTFHFTITTQSSPDETPAGHISWRDCEAELSQKHILIVDDSATLCTFLAQETTAWGIQTQTTQSASEALHMLSQSQTPFDAIMLDIVLAEINHFKLIHDIRKMHSYEHTPIILMGHATRQQNRLPEREQFNLWLLFKPIRRKRLAETFMKLFVYEEEQQDPLSPQLSHKKQHDTTLMAHLHPLHILVAEDNLFNQKVISLLLQRLGYISDIVSNGKEAVAAFDNSEYDVILMDVQMPEMDGIEATQAIRASIPQDKQPFIISMTAHALAGNEEEFLAAGMDGYVSKPINIEELINTLWRATSFTEPSIIADTNTNHTPSAMDDPVSDDTTSEEEEQQYVYVSELTNFLEAIGQNTPEMVEELIFIFLDHVPSQLQDLRSAVEQGDSETLYRISHTLKSSSAQLGALNLSELSKNLETMSKQGDLQYTQRLLNEIEDEFNHVKECLLKVVKEI